MASTGRDLHFDTLLSNLVLAYRPMGFIGEDVFPVVPVDKQSDVYPIWDQAEAFRVDDDQRAPGTEANKIHPTVSSGTYFAKNYALKTPLHLEDRENMDAGYYQLLREGRARFLKDKLMLAMDLRAATLCNTANVGSYAPINSSWQLASVDAIDHISTVIGNVQDLTGYKPNSIIFGPVAWRLFRRNNYVRTAVFGSNASGNPNGGWAGTQQIATLLEMDRVLVGGAYRNTANEGVAQTLASIWGNQVLVYYAPSNPSREAPSYGYSFRWRRPGIPDMGVETHPWNSRTKSEEIELGYYQDEKITGSNLGFLIQAVNSSTGSGVGA